jgi:predicted NBD/HSP70 family sugar kinase
MGGLPDRAVAMLTAVHARPGLTRAEASRALGISTGGAAEVVAALVAARLVAEGAPAPTAARGRPTRRLTAHPQGPLVLAAAITQASWRVDAVQVGGTSIDTLTGRHGAAAAPVVLGALGDAVEELRTRFPDRVRGLGVSAPGVVVDERYLDAVGLGWTDVDLWSLAPEGGLVVADNDATLGAVAEQRRGAARGAASSLHLLVEAGLGGALIDGGRLVGGARGTAGEFGHLPLGDPSVHCPCGASGCWGTAVDGGALARGLGEPAPTDPAGYARQVVVRADAGDDAARAAVGAAATALGRGIAGLVNALDPAVVTLGGGAAELLTAAPEELATACRDGMMRIRRSAPPPVVRAGLGDGGPLVGAAERVWDRWWQQLRH